MQKVSAMAFAIGSTDSNNDKGYEGGQAVHERQSLGGCSLHLALESRHSTLSIIF